MGPAATTTVRERIAATVKAAPTPKAEGPWYTRTLALALCGNLMLWAALPPLGLAPLAWLGPVPLIVLVRMQKLPGRRPFLSLWLAGFVFWLATLYWLTLPHWATSFGWLALSFYLALYLPVFVLLARSAVHELRVPVILAAPIVWTGLALAQAHLLTGFMMAGISHTQHANLMLIQISDLAGEYAVTFVIVWVAACLARMLPVGGARRAWWPAIPLALLVAVVLAYGHYRLGARQGRPGPKVALIQGSIDTEMKADPDEGFKVFDQYIGLSRRAVVQHPDVDLVVWPETMFRYPWFTFAPGYRPSRGEAWDPSELESNSRSAIASTAQALGKPVLLGIETVHHTQESIKRFNSALYTDARGNPLGRYDKMHRVMFGEYVPFASTFPWLYKLTPLPGGIDAGPSADSFTVAGARLAPNICFESTLSHVLRRQIRELARRGEEPDILVNLTNDGWFWGSSELDLHLICGVYRAVECRRPLLVAANTGFSAWIDADGRVVRQGARRATDTIIASPEIDSRQSFYLAHGDWPAGVCLVFCLAIVVAKAGRRIRPQAALRAEPVRPSQSA